ncbi:MAG: hypothetical protein H6579_07150 [Chitinophagales bacterium]|nr:hypothetical protein [Bacteroidota bacterium]MCB9256887.1 hypothetical protein [Chitinophagales bacterium]
MTTTEEVKLLLDKVNLLFNVFAKEDLANISALEKQLLKEQVQNLLHKIDDLGQETKESVVSKLDRNETPQIEPKAEVITREEAKPEVKPMVEEAKKNLNVEEAVQIPREESKASSSLSKPTRTMQQIIDLNKSFIFRSELFKGDNEAYLSFIAKLNTIEEEEASVAYVNKIVAERNWDLEDKVVELMFKAVEKRFTPLLQN